MFCQCPDGDHSLALLHSQRLVTQSKPGDGVDSRSKVTRAASERTQLPGQYLLWRAVDFRSGCSHLTALSLWEPNDPCTTHCVLNFSLRGMLNDVIFGINNYVRALKCFDTECCIREL